MIPIILVSDDQKKIDKYIQDLVTKKNISQNYIFHISPLGKEISIDQIRDIKKNIIFSTINQTLYVIHQFDKASYEAQNAFLKTLEEHPDKIQFILVAENYHSLAQTVISRSQIVILDKNKKDPLDKNLLSGLNSLVEKGQLKILGDKKFQVKNYDDQLELYNNFIDFFRLRLEADPKATKVLREILKIKRFVENNNVDPQNGIDHLIIFARGVYSTS